MLLSRASARQRPAREARTLSAAAWPLRLPQASRKGGGQCNQRREPVEQRLDGRGRPHRYRQQHDVGGGKTGHANASQEVALCRLGLVGGVIGKLCGRESGMSEGVDELRGIDRSRAVNHGCALCRQGWRGRSRRRERSRWPSSTQMLVGIKTPKPVYAVERRAGALMTDLIFVPFLGIELPHCMCTRRITGK